MAARIIHFGEDRWHRVAVLRHAGLGVEVCQTPGELVSTLRTGTDPDAIVISQSRVLDPVTAKSLARTVTSAPVIFFPHSATDPADSNFDLVVPPLTRPDEWLQDVWKLIERSRELQSEWDSTRRVAAKLRKESREAVESSRAERARARKLTDGFKMVPRNPWTDLE